MKQTTLAMTSSDNTHDIELQIGRYFIASNTSFLQVENKEFGKLLQQLKPGVKIPNRRRLAGPILDKIYMEEKEKAKVQLANCNATLALDGWSSLTNDPVVGVSITTSVGTFLVNTVDTSGESQTSTYLVELLKMEKEKCETEWGVKIKSVVTDSASNMKSMREAVSDPENFFHVYGCQAHAMNLVEKDISLTAQPVIKKVVAVLKQLRNCHAESALLKTAKNPRPPLPVDTRWNSVADSLEYFTNYWSSITIIFEKTLKPPDTLYRYMEEISVKRGAQDLLRIFKPIAVSLDKLKSEKSHLEIFLKYGWTSAPSALMSTCQNVLADQTCYPFSTLLTS